jgi:alanine-glyoxylate transaminase/serine-glyoxylate transaminase/serine-pyruvate transaminase
MPPAPFSEARPPARILLGPGPSNIHSRVQLALAKPLLGYLDPAFLSLLDEIAAMLRTVFDLRDGLALCLPGTGGSGMEAAFVNLVEPGDTVVVAVNGFFGERMATIVERCGAKVATVTAPWGQVIEPDALARELRRHLRVKAVAVVHGETSTGVLQPLQELARLAAEHDALFIVDAVTSLGGAPLSLTETPIDFCYSATQKCLGAPPGLAPVALSDRALRLIEARERPPQSWYLDLGLLRRYWEGETLTYHHTPPMPLLYALHEALRLIHEEGLPARIARHKLHGQALRAGLQALGLQPLVPEEHCLYQLTTVAVPEGVDEAAVRSALLREHNIEIGGGLGAFRGRVWRIGLMGESSTANNVLLCLAALETVLRRQGVPISPGAGTAAAAQVLSGAATS